MAKNKQIKKLVVLAFISLFLIPVFSSVRGDEQWLTYRSVATLTNCTESAYPLSSIFQPYLWRLPNGTIVLSFEASGSGAYGGMVDFYHMYSYDDGDTWTDASLFAPNSDVCAPDVHFWDGTRSWFSRTLSCPDSSHSCLYVRYADSDYLNISAYSAPIEIWNWSNPGRWLSGSTILNPINGGFWTRNDETLIIPCQYNTGGAAQAACVWTNKSGVNISDWNGTLILPTVTNEHSYVETVNGSLYAISRNEAVVLSDIWNIGFGTEGDITNWTNQGEAVPPPTVATKTWHMRHTLASEGYEKNRLLLTYNTGNIGRHQLSAAISYDEGLSWQYSRIFDNPYPGNDNYCRMYPNAIILENKSVMICYSAGEGSTYTDIKVARMNIEWISSGVDEINYTGESENNDPQFISVCNGNNGTIFQNETPIFIGSMPENTNMIWLQISNSATNWSDGQLEVNLSNISLSNFPSHYTEINSTSWSFRLPDEYAVTTNKYYYIRYKTYTLEEI